MSNNSYDDLPEGQMELWDVLEGNEQLVAVSRVFARARQGMNLAEQKTFIMALTKLKFTEEPKGEVVYLDKRELAKVVGISDEDDGHLSINLRRAVGELPKNSFIEISDKDKGLYVNGNVITTIAFYRNRVRIRFNPDYISLFTGLSKDYITVWAEDIFQLGERRSVIFYEYLRQITDTRKGENITHMSTRAIKQLFNIPFDGPGSYVKPSGIFNRSQFEARVIDPICADLTKTQMITLLVNQNGKPYNKIKRGGEVVAYEFSWTFTLYPKVVSGEEYAEIVKKPQTLKVANDILKGEKKPKEKKQKNGFHNFPQRTYDYEELERKLLGSKS